MMTTDSKQPYLHVPTIVAISIVAWSLFAVLHEIVGHGGSAILLGENLQGAVSTTVHLTDFYDLDHVTGRIGWWGFRTVAAAGTFVNLLTGIIALLLLRSKHITQSPLRYFLWMFASISIFQQAFWLAVMPFLSIGGDWTAYFIRLEPSYIWKSGITILGLILLWIGLYLPIRLFNPFGELAINNSRSLVRRVTLIPMVAAFIIQFLSVLWSPLSGPRHTIIVSIFSFIPLIIWLILVNLIRWPHTPLSAGVFPLDRSNVWLIFGVVSFYLFVFVLGTGIGSFTGHPSYLNH
jgi:hypothetical protein